MGFFLKLLLLVNDLNLLPLLPFLGELLLFFNRFYDKEFCRPGTTVLCRRSGLLSGRLYYV